MSPLVSTSTVGGEASDALNSKPTFANGKATLQRSHKVSKDAAGIMKKVGWLLDTSFADVLNLAFNPAGTPAVLSFQAILHRALFPHTTFQIALLIQSLDLFEPCTCACALT